MRTRGRKLWVVSGLCMLASACVDPNAADPGAKNDDGIERSSAALSISPGLINAFETSLRVDLLYPYYPTAHDGSNGGFVEDRSGTWALQQDSDKFISEQARLTWTAAKASQFYAASNPTAAAQYRASATVGFQFLQKMWRDSSNGFGLMADRNGSNPRNSGKESYIVYGNAFGMYAAAAYYGLTGDSNGLNLAINAYNYLNTYFWDSQYGGYYLTASDKRKDTNTNVHCLEALIELYNDLPASHALRSDVASRLSTLLTRFHDSAMHCPATNDCWAYPVMNQDWTSTASDVSFGHDLELSMLMVQAISALGQDPATSPYLAKIKKVVDFTFSHGGYRSDGGFYYTGTYSNGTVTVNDSQIQWWPQAEGLGALCLMRKLFPSDTTYEPLISKSWGFIDAQIIDDTNHGWVRQAGDWNIAKGWEWHCNYHNGRALMNCMNWVGDGAPVATCSDGIQNQGETGVDCGGPCPACTVTNAIWLEAEAGTRSGNPTFAVNSDGNASGGQYIQATSNSLNSAGPNRATYTFTAAAGTYKVWGRALTPSIDSNSFWVSMDGGAFVKWNDIPISSSWVWDDVHNSNSGGAVMTYNLSQGSHTLVIANRENGTRLDKLYITAKGDVPTGFGGNCTTCSALGATCGTPSDGCGGTLSCGTCGTGQQCNASYQCVCAPTSCAAQGAECGTISDGCGGTLTCGSCAPAETCFGNQCVCVPKTCASIPAACGNPSDACGGTLSCGTCPTGQVCTASYQCVTDAAPVVNAGIDVTIQLPAVLLINGTVTDDGLPAPPTLTVGWTKVSGPGTVTFSPANAAVTTVGFSSGGVYVLRLTASDGLLSASDDVQITVLGINTAPVVNAGVDRSVGLTVPPATLTIAGSVTDDGLPAPPTLTIGWSLVSGPAAVSFNPANAATTTVSFTAIGTYVLRLSASDGALSGQDDVQVTVVDGNLPPVVNVGADRTVTLPATLTIAATVTDDGVPVPPALSMVWTVTGGPGGVVFNPANAATTTVTFPAAGTYVLRLTASDGLLSGYDELQVAVSNANTAPVVNAGADRTVTLPSTLAIAGTVTDDNLPAPPTLTITWSKVSGPGTVTFSPANAASTTVSFSAAGTYVLRLSASDGALSGQDDVQVVVSGSSGNPCDGLCNGPTSFTFSGSYSSGNLGTSTVCRQTTSVIRSGNCGNFASGRTLSVNGTQMTCNGGSWSTMPATRNGGYCISVTSGDYAWGYFTLW